MKNRAFTLAEVLITLGIIGVVAAMTIPALINNVRAVKLRSQFNKAHAELQQAFRLMADNESVSPKDYQQVPKNYFYKQFIKYFKSGFDCSTSALGINKNLPCYSDMYGTPYKTLDSKNSVYSGFLDDGQIGVMDGVLILVENYSGRLWLSVDINGYNNGPNQWGVDLFTFQVTDDGLFPMGNQATTYNDLDKYCNPKESNAYNGIACAEKAVKDTNYFKDLYKQK